MAKKTTAPKPVEFPVSILVRVAEHGTPGEFLLVGKTPSDFGSDDTLSVATARYVLAGTGVTSHTAPQYVETAKA